MIQDESEPKPDSLEVIRLFHLEGLEPLRAAALQEEFAFLERLANEWDEGGNRFSHPDEIFLGAYLSERLVAVGGLNRQKADLARVRHVYVLPEVRRQGIASALLTEILEFAKPRYSSVVLRTMSPEAAQLYEAFGFLPTEEGPPDFATHRLQLTCGDGSS